MKTYRQHGVTLIELMITIAMVTIVILSVGIVLVDTQRGWNKMYNRVHGAVSTDSYVAKKVFDRVVRKSSKKRYALSPGNLVVFYYNDLSSTYLDRYTSFQLSGTNLLGNFGSVDSSEALSNPTSSMVVARNVEAADFSVSGASVRMALRLNDGEYAVTVTSSAVRHNE
ncbi:MAG: PulJ/GspJ family protein [Planctomycetota bacterium]|jgi:Tfp pilus assembly protein PilV